jgi:hypothetical protein
VADHDDDGDPEFPAVVRAAGLIWLGIGGLGVLGGLAVLAAPVAVVLGTTCFLWVTATIPVWVTAGLRGLRVARGAIPDVDIIVDGFRSIVGGGILLILGLVVLFVVGPLFGLGRWEAILVGGSFFGIGVLLILAGSLALGGHARYEAWWRINHPTPGHPPDDETDDPGG